MLRGSGRKGWWGEEKGDEVPGGILDTWVPVQVGGGDAFFRWSLCEAGSKTRFWE